MDQKNGNRLRQKHLRKTSQICENMMHTVFLICACASIAAVVLICWFIFGNSIPAFQKIGIVPFLSGMKWKPGSTQFGILPMIVGSLFVTGGALTIGIPIGVLCAVFMADFCPKKLYKVMKPGIELMAGIPSIIYGFFGLVILVPFVRMHFGGKGYSILTASIMLGMMILPTVITVAESALRAVPRSYYEGSLALGASHERSIFFVVLPSAKNGVLAGVILGVGRAIGETMAVNMVAGNQARIPGSILDGVRTLTTNIVIEMGYAQDLHREALIATAAVLFVFILIINLSFSAIKRKKG